MKHESRILFFICVIVVGEFTKTTFEKNPKKGS